MAARTPVPEPAASPAAEPAAKSCSHHPALELYQSQSGCKCGKLRPPRKLHTLVGVWLMLFVAAHLAICLTGMTPSHYQGTVDRVEHWIAYLPGTVLLPILLPLLVQTASGLFLLYKEGMKYNIKRCDRGSKLRFFLQRVSGLAILAFLLLHMGSMYGWGAPTRFVARGAAFASTVSAFRPWNSPAANAVTLGFLLAGIWATAFHAANGAWSGAILLKIVDSERGRIWSQYLCLCLGLGVGAVGTVAWYAFAFHPQALAALAAAR